MFIVLEGLDGCGKTTVSHIVAEELSKKHEVLLTYEPGFARNGLYRQLIMEDPNSNAFRNLLLFELDRLEHIQNVIEPALKEGKWVILQRYTYSTLAYEGYGMGLDLNLINELNKRATKGLKPDMVFYLKLPARIALERLSGKDKDPIESQQLEFFERVEAGYDSMFQMNQLLNQIPYSERKRPKEQIIVLDATKPPEDIAKAILNRIEQFITTFREVER
jgi:dTMP kinase